MAINDKLCFCFYNIKAALIGLESKYLRKLISAKYRLNRVQCNTYRENYAIDI